ncbi:ankyrin repeat domain-containing protein 13C isoform X4 [Monodelphis domestica]|uniref:ankyrin repeat domain-containing protein 13C isoform X4 n=1 Tax=Monodelphis domestica TaxID=13616 RepID=UPI0024E27135|nr:ankyrin repeat domain-containing protein 13C isoform X4 [Monodelphis domestica]
MTGEKIRSLRRDPKPSGKEDSDLLEPGDDEAAAAPGPFTAARGAGPGGGRPGSRGSSHPLPVPSQPLLPSLSTPGSHSSFSSYASASSIAGGAAADPRLIPALYPVHECVFKGDVKRLSSLIRTHQIAQKDLHECAHLLLAHNAPVKVKNAQGWSPLAEAISYGDRQMMPLLSRMLPSDACKIYKQGINIRLDTTLIDFTDLKCQRGDLSFIFTGDSPPSQSFVVLDNEQKVYQKIHHEESETETEEEVDILMSSDIYSATLSTKTITFTRAQTGWLFRENKTERVGNFLANFYLVNGLILESRKRREHLSQEDIIRNKAILESLSKGGTLMEQNFEPHRRQSLTPPPPNTITWEEYVSAETGKAPHLGRELVCKENKKMFKATVAMSPEFPLGIESLLNVLEVIAPFKHFSKLREFVQMKLPPGFPVKLDIPVFPTITATVTFLEFRYAKFDNRIFAVPDDYKEDPNRFPDL